MPQTIQDSTGQNIEVFLPEEVKAREEAALEAYKAEHPDKSEELTKLQDDLKTAQDALAKVGDKDHNFGELRKQVDTANKALEDFKKSVPDLINSAKNEVLEGVNKTHYEKTLESLAAGDEELQKKIELHYKRLADPATNEKEISKKLTDAYVLATAPEDQGALTSNVISSGNGGRPKINSNQKFSSEEKEFGQKLAQAGGLTLEDKDFQ